MNPKRQAWDRVGPLFWALGREDAKPTSEAVDAFLDGLPERCRLAVVGATTRSLIEVARDRGFRVLVLDFSPVMCTMISRECAVESRLWDATTPPPPTLRESQDVVLAERLINRFDRREVVSAIRHLGAVVRAGGELRLSVRMGLYEIDRRIMSEASGVGLLAQVFDEQSNTIDYAKAAALLDKAIVPHGKIPRNKLSEWYYARGREARFEEEDFRSLVAEVAPDLDCTYQAQPGAPETLIVRMKRVS